MKNGRRKHLPEPALKQIKQLRIYKFENRDIIKLIENNLKPCWKSPPQNEGKTMRELVEENKAEIINRIGVHGLQKYYKYIKVRNHTKFICKFQKRKQKDEENRKTIDDYKSKSWYLGTQKVTGKIKQQQNGEIKRIIKPKFATKKIPPNLKITHDIFTHGSQETCETVGEYMATVGSEENPAHKLVYPCDRNKARELDAPYDLEEKYWNDHIPEELQTTQQKSAIRKWKNEVKKIYGYITDAEILQAVNQIKTGKAYHGQIPIVFVKQTIEELMPLLRLIFHFWMESGITTNEQAQRLLKPILKPKKNVNLVGALRPVEYGHILMKVYTVIITNRNK